MKKLLALLLAVCLMLSLAACGGEPETKEPEETPENNEETPNDDKVVEGEKLDATLWSLVYDSELWKYEEDDFNNDEEWSDIVMIIPDGEDSYTINAEIQASIEDTLTFRDYLDSYGFDQYEYAVNNAYELVNIGGVDCLMQEGNYWGEPCLRYFGRVEKANATVFIEIIGDYEDECVDTLLAGLTFNLPDIGNVDYPWHWDGEAFSSDTKTAMAGTHTLTSQWIPFEDYIITSDIFDHSVAAANDKVYILGDEALKQFAYDGSSLTYEKDIDIEGDYELLQTADDGTIWMSGFMEALVSMKDGVQTASYEDTDTVAMHPSGTWGINWFSGPECKKISIVGDTVSTSVITFPQVDTIMHLAVDENHIYVCGNDVSDSGHKVFVYDLDGNHQTTLFDEQGEGLGSITFIAETPNGFIGLDGNMREVILWTANGDYIGSISDGDLFGTSYPWFCSGVKLSDGSILVIMTEERADYSGTEVIAFKLSGF